MIHLLYFDIHGTEQVSVAVTLYICIPKVFDSNLGRSDNHVEGFRGSSQSANPSSEAVQ